MLTGAKLQMMNKLYAVRGNGNSQRFLYIFFLHFLTFLPDSPNKTWNPVTSFSDLYLIRAVIDKILLILLIFYF